VDTMDTTGRALVDHWKWAADKGLMNRNTAASLGAACSQVLGALDDWEQLDVRSLDIEDVAQRFQNRRSKDFKPASLEAYKRRFQQAVDLFLKYVEAPSSWKPGIRKRRSNAPRRVSRPDQVEHNEHAEPDAPQGMVVPRDGLLNYPFPLGEGRIAHLKLPGDLKLADVRRLSAFLQTLAVDFDPKD